MNFNSYIFILAFLPITIVLFYCAHRIGEQLGKWCLIISSLIFVGYADIRYVIFIVGSIVINFLLAKCVVSHRQRVTKLFYILALIVNISVLGIFKYSTFALNGINALFHSSYSFSTAFVPIGISFITFQQIMFLTDLQKGKIELKFGDYVFYILYFPKLVQGPLTKYETLIRSYKEKDKKFPNADDFACGLYFFVTGLARKVLLADFLAQGANWGYSNLGNLTSVEAWITMLCYTLQIYFDFSGYSCMAVGISKMLSIDLPDNFDTPYRAVSVNDFWKRWHISLTSFLREYIYFPLGGSRKGKYRTYFNILVIFLISGLWHGAACTYIFWGLLHGIALCLNKLLEKVSPLRIKNKFLLLLQWLLTFLYINISWVFFRAGSLSEAFWLIGRGFAFDSVIVSEELLQCFYFAELELLTSRFEGIGIILNQYSFIPAVVTLGVATVISLVAKDRVESFRPTLFKSIAIMALYVWSVVSLAHVAEFIYGTF